MRTHLVLAARETPVAFVISIALLGAAVGCGSDGPSKNDATVIAAVDGSPADRIADLPTPGPDVGPDQSADQAADEATLAGIDVNRSPVDAAASEAGPIDTAGSTVDGGSTFGIDSGTNPGIDGGALPSCTSLVNPVFILTGDTQVPIVRDVGKVLRAQANPVTLVWVATGSCSIIDTLYSGANITPNGSYIPSDPSWNSTSGTVPTCAMPTGGVPPDLGIPIVFPQACSTATAPAGLGAIKGPVQSFVFVVPTASFATAISAEEAYLVFGFGQTGQVSPWTNESFYFIRPATKGTQVSLGAIINVPAAKWKGQRLDQSTAVASGVATATSPDQAIGILGTEIYDSAANRAALRSLTFQAYGQNLSYLPDSIAIAFDKRSIRDGHYVAWSHVFYMTSVDASGTPTNAKVKTLIDVFTGGPGAASTGIDSIALLAGKGLVPSCAMTVTRSTEGGNLSAFTPADPCGCAFEATVGKAPVACAACTADTQCTKARCLRGFCESADGRTSLGDCVAPGADYASIINSACTGRLASPKEPMPQLQQANGGTLPALP